MLKWTTIPPVCVNLFDFSRIMNIKTAVWLCAAVILCINVDVAFTNCNYYCEEAQRFKIVSWNLEVFGATKWNENNGANRPHLINVRIACFVL